MGYVPDDAEWYIAEIVEEIVVAGDPRNVVHCNFVLVRADSPEEAYDRAMELGRNSEQFYLNASGVLVEIRFRGLRDLNVIHDPLEHGAELIYSREVGVDEQQIAQLITPRAELGVFAPIELSDDGPDIVAAEITEELRRRLRLNS